MIPTSWEPQRRASDHELVGYLVTEALGTTPLTLFGYPLGGPVDRETAVGVLETRGLACLAGAWWLQTADGREVRVAILSAFPDRIVAVRVDLGFYDHLSERFDLAVPAAGLRPAEGRQLTS